MFSANPSNDKANDQFVLAGSCDLVRVDVGLIMCSCSWGSALQTAKAEDAISLHRLCSHQA